MQNAREYYEMDERAGIIVNKHLGYRAFVFGLGPWASLTAKLFDTFGSVTKVILFEIGKSYGRSVAQEEEKRGELDRQLRINFLARMATIAGWGKVTNSNESANVYRVKIQRCVFCAGITDSNLRSVACFFVRGVISGFAESILGANEVVEDHCGLDFCEFKVSIR